MATGRALFCFALICVAFAMLAAVGMAHEGHENHQPSSPAPSPGSPPGTGNGGPNAAADFPPHLFSTTLFASLAFMLPFCLSFIY
ncbi:hypothetical protein Ddye_000139 [Dipteronia dyeriana]|uniref:Uncharacterized protein n=1 Tax=Dipteronia dyeriana TaxID=168575 RepID=A0AAD9XLS5_9ROSI|nr:hypothetical protein Ddye_000139 [Dipteronia dyeriana]